MAPFLIFFSDFNSVPDLGHFDTDPDPRVLITDLPDTASDPDPAPFIRLQS
jgi:hypothetical protein